MLRVRSRAFLIVFLLSFGFISIFVIQNPYKLKTIFSSATRPLWDTPTYPSKPIINLATAELFDSQQPDYICQLHNNAKARRAPFPEVWDAIIFSHDVEMLEIRIAELQDVVDKFIILESNVTYSGQPKRLYFDENRALFEQWADKIHYKPFLDTNTEGFYYK